MVRVSHLLPERVRWIHTDQLNVMDSSLSQIFVGVFNQLRTTALSLKRGTDIYLFDVIVVIVIKIEYDEALNDTVLLSDMECPLVQGIFAVVIENMHIVVLFQKVDNVALVLWVSRSDVYFFFFLVIMSKIIVSLSQKFNFWLRIK